MLLLPVLLTLLSAVDVRAPGTYEVGVAAIGITPTYPVRLSGFGFRRQESEGVTQPIWAKALAIGSDVDGSNVLLTVDNLGVPDAIRTELADRLQKRVGLKPERLALTATHTHTAPMLTAVAPTLFGVAIPPEHQQRIDRYTRELVDKLEHVALAALKDRAPAKLFWGMGTVGFAMNRRTKGGPVDHDLPLLVVKDLQGKLRAVYISYACHCVTLSNNKISGDWAGYALEHLQRRHPETVALVSVGCGADSNPNSGVTGDKADVAAAQGDEIAREVDRLLQGYLAPLSAKLSTRFDRFELAFDDLPTKADWEKRAKEAGAVGHHARVQLEKLSRGQALQTTLPYSMQTWTFGDQLALVFLPGEVVVDYSRRLKRELDPGRLWVNAYANDCPCYIPSERILKEGRYEGGDAMIYYDRPTRLRAGLENQIVDAVKKQLLPTFKAPFDPEKLQGTMPLAPQQAQATLRTALDFTVELVAAEPLVASPVAIDFGPDGRLWVAEMADYPSGLNGRFQPGGRVRVLEDTDGDGRYDKSTVFLEGIPFPTGLTVWRKGVLICAAPDILYAEDTDGDGKADVVKKLFSGFATHNFQARVNSLEFGLDGWVHGSGGLFGGEIRGFGSDKPVSLTNRDFRIQPDTGIIEAAAGRTQQGRVRDDWDNWFGCDNSVLLRHYPLPDNYLRRNPHVPPLKNEVYVPDYPNSNQVIPGKKGIQLFSLSGLPGKVTAACGLGMYRDDLLGPDFRGNAFICEPVNLVVHRLKLQSKGTTFSGRRAPEELAAEFLGSPDNWFRPVQARTGPDGALWIVDMYRLVIEHPIWIPPAELGKVDVRAGHNMGRIYRVYPKGKAPRPMPNLDKLDTGGLVAALDTPNGIRGDLAMQMLAWRQDKAAVPLLEQLVGKCPRPEARLHALAVLDSFGALTSPTLLIALADAHPGVRRLAVRLAESRLSSGTELAAVIRLKDDADPLVRLQVACSLGASMAPAATAALTDLALKSGTDQFLEAAILSSMHPRHLSGVARRVFAEGDEAARGRLAGPLLTLAAAYKDRDALGQMLKAVTTAHRDRCAAWQFSALAELLEALDRMGAAPLEAAYLTDVRVVLAQARAALAAEREDDSYRRAAARVLGHDTDQWRLDLGVLGAQLVPRNPLAVQAAAVTAIGRIRLAEVPGTLLERWKSFSPGLRLQVFDVLLSRPEWTRSLLVAVQQGRVQAGQIDASRRQRLLQLKDPALRQLAAKLLADSSNTDRKKVVAEYQSVTALASERARGKEVFAKRCASCHLHEGVGHAVGPDLGQMTNKSPEAMLIAILDPNQALDDRYVQYAAVTKDGRLFNGILASETATSITLKEQEGKESVLLRGQLDELLNTGKSLMPEGMEKDLSRQDLADVVAYVLGAGTPPKQVAGNKPTTISQRPDGAIELRASTCEIYGRDITFEAPFGNIGCWHDGGDYLVWNIQVEKPANFDVWFDYACDDGVAGNTFILQGGRDTARGPVAGTGGWNKYRQANVGDIALDAGLQRVVLRPLGKVSGALLDLRRVVLVPEGKASPFGQVQAATDLAIALLDDKRNRGDREQIIEDHPELATALLVALTADLPADAKEEYRRIPWIWRVAVAAGRRNDALQLKSLLAASLPKPGDALRDWQAVVLGGGVINGISRAGVWPGERLTAILKDDAALSGRWTRALELASTMANNDKVPTGTRYDALRMLGLGSWEQHGPQLVKYLVKGSDDELQMGAISALGDMPSRTPDVATALLGGLGHYAKPNRELALDALIRDEVRMAALLNAIAAGKLKTSDIGEKRLAALRAAKNERLREQARQLSVK